jgi:hypothetical protein
MGGVKNSFSAFAKIMGNHLNDTSIVPGLTNAQLFFVAYAQVCIRKNLQQIQFHFN